MANLNSQLDDLFATAEKNLEDFAIKDAPISRRISYVANCAANRAGVRLILSCMLAKIDKPILDPREPITEIGSNTCFSGRTYDETYLTAFVSKYKLPCNSTTAFLTPAFRNMKKPFDKTSIPNGRPPLLYENSFQLLEDVATGTVPAKDVFLDMIRHLIRMRDDEKKRLTSLIEKVERTSGAYTPSSEDIVNLLSQHIACKHSSRLPVLGVAAAYAAASKLMGERAMPLKGHNSADLQTGAAGDIEICLTTDEKLITVYEMKQKAVTCNDIQHAVTKVVSSNHAIDNYVIITTEPIPKDVSDIARSMYERTGTEIVVLDYLGFVRHFLHFFHRHRHDFLDAYQEMLLAEPASAVSQSLKEAFLALRNAMQSDSMQSDSMQSDSMQSDSMQGDSMQGDSMQGDSMQGDSMQGDSMLIFPE